MTYIQYTEHYFLARNNFLQHLCHTKSYVRMKNVHIKKNWRVECKRREEKRKKRRQRMKKKLKLARKNINHSQSQLHLKNIKFMVNCWYTSWNLLSFFSTPLQTFPLANVVLSSFRILIFFLQFLENKEMK